MRTVTYQCDRCRKPGKAGEHTKIRTEPAMSSGSLVYLCGPCWRDFTEAFLPNIDFVGD